MLLIQNLSFNNFPQMESAISLRYCPFPYSSKGFQGAGSIRFHLRFNHATPLCAPQFSTTRHPVTRSVGHANCILGRFSQPSQNDGRGSKIFRGVTGASLVLACVLGLFHFKMNPKLTTAHASFDPSSMFNSSTFNSSEVDDHGKMALKSLLKIMNDADDATHQNKTIPSKFNGGPSRQEVDILKSIAIGQSKSRQGRQALKILEAQYDICKDEYQEEEQTLIVALVEFNICRRQEKLEESRKKLDEEIQKLLKPKELSPKEKCDEMLELYKSNNIGHTKRWIAELILYKAIVHTILEYKDAGKSKEAHEWRKAFSQIL